MFPGQKEKNEFIESLSNYFQTVYGDGKCSLYGVVPVDDTKDHIGFVMQKKECHNIPQSHQDIAKTIEEFAQYNIGLENIITSTTGAVTLKFEEGKYLFRAQLDDDDAGFGVTVAYQPSDEFLREHAL